MDSVTRVTVKGHRKPGWCCGPCGGFFGEGLGVLVPSGLPHPILRSSLGIKSLWGEMYVCSDLKDCGIAPCPFFVKILRRNSCRVSAAEIISYLRNSWFVLIFKDTELASDCHTHVRVSCTCTCRLLLYQPYTWLHFVCLSLCGFLSPVTSHSCFLGTLMDIWDPFVCFSGTGWVMINAKLVP